MCVSMNNKICFPTSCGEHSVVLNSHFSELSDSCGDVIERQLEAEREGYRGVAQTGQS